MTKSSKEAFFKNAEKRATNKELVIEALKLNPNRSRFGIGEITGLGHLEAQRRLSDLKNEDRVIETGTRKHGNCEISLYSLKLQLELYPRKPKPTLKQFIESEAPHLLHKYDALYNHKL